MNPETGKSGESSGKRFWALASMVLGVLIVVTCVLIIRLVLR